MPKEAPKSADSVGLCDSAVERNEIIGFIAFQKNANASQSMLYHRKYYPIRIENVEDGPYSNHDLVTCSFMYTAQDYSLRGRKVRVLGVKDFLYDQNVQSEYRNYTYDRREALAEPRQDLWPFPVPATYFSKPTSISPVIKQDSDQSCVQVTNLFRWDMIIEK